MDDKKPGGGTATLERPAEAVKEETQAKTTSPEDPKLKAREQRTERLIHDMESKMRKAALQFNGSEEEAIELGHDMAGRIKRISAENSKDESFEGQVEAAVNTALKYYVDKTRAENKDKEENEENSEDEKENGKEKKEEKEREKRYVPHAAEEPTVFTPKIDTSDKKSETVNDIAAITNVKTDIKNNPLLGKPLNKPVNPQPKNKPSVPVQSNQNKKPIPQGLQKGLEVAHNTIAHAIQNPTKAGGHYVINKKIEPPKLHTKVLNSFEDPEAELKRQFEDLKKRLLQHFINRKSYTGRAWGALKNKRKQKKQKGQAVPLKNIFGDIKKKPALTNFYSPAQEMEEGELVYTQGGNELVDRESRGRAVEGNINSELYIPEIGRKDGDGFSEIETTSPSKPKPVYPEPARRPDDDGEEGGGGGGKKKKKKRRAIDTEGRRLARQAAQQIITKIPPPVWAGIAIALVIAFLLIYIAGLIFGGGDYQKNQQGDAVIPVTISKTGPAKGSIGQPLVYSIVVGYAGQASDVTIVDKLPANVTYVSSNPAGVYDATARTITWQASVLKIALTNPVNMTVGITLQATANNVFITNVATATVTEAAAGGGASNQNWAAPTATNCGGKYTFISPLKMNFGDPSCNFNKNDLYTQLKAQDPAHADIFFNKILTCESGYDPNAYAPPSTGTPDASGAWGLFQMGSARTPGVAPDPNNTNTWGKNDRTIKRINGKDVEVLRDGKIIDRGDVPWQMQISNATTYNLTRNGGDPKQYWSCAR